MGAMKRLGEEVIDMKAKFKIIPQYTPHPTNNFIQYLTPQQLAEAGRHMHEISYRDLLEVHDRIGELAGVVLQLRPALVFFFATGGIPIVFPVMKRLEKEMDLTRNLVFHMFPGLAWNGDIEGQRPAEYFRNEAGQLLRATIKQGIRPCIAAIDTTNSGNAVNLAVGAITNACLAVGLPHADIYVMGIVNASSNVTHQDDSKRLPLTHGARTDISVVTPKGYTPSGPLTSGQFVTFTAAEDASANVASVRIGYWVVNELFTEDKAELLGIAAVQARLGVQTTGTSGRMKILFDNGRSLVDSGLSAIGKRLLYLLESDRTSQWWQQLDRLHKMNPKTDEAKSLDVDSALERDAFMSLLEMDYSPQATIVHLLSTKARLQPIQIYWLARQEPFPESAMKRVAGALRWSMAGRSEEDDQTIREAVGFFRRAYPEAASSEHPELGLAELRKWWLAVHKQKRSG
jgi:hypothetical protein